MLRLFDVIFIQTAKTSQKETCLTSSKAMEQVCGVSPISACPCQCSLCQSGSSAATMKVTFYFVLAFIAVALAMPEKKENELKTEPKLDNPQTKAVEKKEVPKDSEENEEVPKESEENEELSTPTPSNEETMTYPPPTPEEKRCSELIGKYVNDTFVGLVVNHDLQKILEKYGGPPGKVNATWTEKEDAPVDKDNLEKRPLPDADEKYWIYRYGESDGKTYIRIEHAVRRFSGTPKAFLEIRGTVYFTPDDFCGNSRKAEYTVDDRGFTFEVTHEYCSIGSTVSCAWPASCTADEHGNITSCVAAPSNALLAALVGGGK